MITSAGNIWRERLSHWSIPQEIIDLAPENPWIHPPVMFQIPDVIELNPSHQRAIEIMPPKGSILDIGCGGGVAAFAVVPPASQVFGVDHQSEMLEMFSQNANKRKVASQTFEGFWPEIAMKVPIAEVVSAHHVVYNVANIEDFILAAQAHASRRVVIEMPQKHPLTNASQLWKHFWNIDRPTDPTTQEFVQVLKELGINAKIEFWQGKTRQEQNLEQQAHFSRIRLCLNAEREPEVLDFLKAQPKIPMRDLATIWWDTF